MEVSETHKELFESEIQFHNNDVFSDLGKNDVQKKVVLLAQRSAKGHPPPLSPALTECFPKNYKKRHKRKIDESFQAKITSRVCTQYR